MSSGNSKIRVECRHSEPHNGRDPEPASRHGFMRTTTGLFIEYVGIGYMDPDWHQFPNARMEPLT